MGSQVIKAPPYSASDIFYINAIPLVCVCVVICHLVHNAKPLSHGVGFCSSQASQEAAAQEPLLSKLLASGKPF